MTGTHHRQVGEVLWEVHSRDEVRNGGKNPVKRMGDITVSHFLAHIIPYTLHWKITALIYFSYITTGILSLP